MAKRMFVYCRTQFEMQHRWAAAPDEVAFLRNWHRHIFHVKASVEVGHNNRDVEFIKLKWAVEKFIRKEFEHKMKELSCEMIAEQIREHLADNGFSVRGVDVSEDGENGAIILYGDSN